jgi:carbamate kinase
VSSKTDKPVLLVALGGNALIRKGQQGTLEEQFANLRVPMNQIARLSRRFRIIITHGNGPQVGALLLQQESTAQVPALPLEILVAQTQGWLGYMIESTLDSELMALGIHAKPLVSLISYVVVDEKDSAFLEPSKPIGPVLSPDAVAQAAFHVKKTAKGFRRVVASPQPLTVVEKREIKKLIKLDFIVICCGGGGIPVVREGRSFSGVDAVIDKDLASACLAQDVKVDVFCIATDVPGAALNYGTPDEKFLPTLTLDQASAYAAQGHFPPGSMEPKIQACLRYLQAGGNRALVCSVEEIEKALAGQAGTEVVKD